jgi:hypothetical protein
VGDGQVASVVVREDGYMFNEAFRTGEDGELVWAVAGADEGARQ